ncbi:MAG: LptF/LptG family permease [Isosphaeraceae bacterium]|nr:LptF/LptG family permease [Isosphaeraceae bacterium]
MRILDRERYWAFLKAYLICFTALVGLNVVIDAFSNFDEFLKRASGVELIWIMGRYYLVHMSQFYDRLCGVISMMAAIFTVTWMQRNNELLAMLAAGLSTQRVIRPVLVSALIVSVLSVINQEVIMARCADELQRVHADDGKGKVEVHGAYDSSRIYIHGRDADRATNSIVGFNATLPVGVTGEIRELEGSEARYIPLGHPTSPLKGGWLTVGSTLDPPFDEAHPPGEDSLVVPVTDLRGLPLPFGNKAVPAGDVYFLRSDLDFQSITRRSEWFQFATTVDLIRGISLPSNEAQKLDIAVFLHGRLLRPVLSMVLMFMSLPLVLGGYGRNMFVNLGLALGTSALFYATSFIGSYLGSNAVIPPELSSWAPLIGFGTYARVRWWQIRT